MTQALQDTPQQPTAFERVLGLIEGNAKTKDMLNNVDNADNVRAKLEAHAERFDAATDQMAAAFAFAQDPNQGRRPAMPGSLQSAFTQAALKLRRDMPDIEQLPYVLHKLAIEVSQVKFHAANQQGQAENLSAVQILRRDKGVEAIGKDAKTVEIIRHPLQAKNKSPSP